MTKVTSLVILKEFEKRIVEVFEVFDYTGNKTIDVREIPTVLCSLGCVPSKNEINEIIKNIQEPECHGNVHISKFLPFVSNLIVNYRFHPASAEELLKAFQILDKDSTGYLNKDYLSEIMTERGEQFTQEELKEMMSVAINSLEGGILYEMYLNHIIVSIPLRIISQ
ncbi:dynein regulatory complex protein 8-like isoform X2 [Planococcus citri]|uniref:dynein regulatory complex protein 8-like isoform X2 n=1 Tax=Planococcus citri TaxID=170843 RepID=UPI0031F8648B